MIEALATWMKAAETSSPSVLPEAWPPNRPHTKRC